MKNFRKYIICAVLSLVFGTVCMAADALWHADAPQGPGSKAIYLQGGRAEEFFNRMTKAREVNCGYAIIRRGNGMSCYKTNIGTQWEVLQCRISVTDLESGELSNKYPGGAPTPLPCEEIP